MAVTGFSAINYSLNESFESGIPSTWTQEVLSSESALWAVDNLATNPTGAYDGNQRVALRNTTGSDKGYITRLITPVMDLSAVDAPQLSFAYAQPAYTGFHDTLVVYYRLNQSSDWVLLAKYNDAKNAWTPVQLGLVATAGQATAFQLAFEARENMGAGVVLDAVRVFPESKCQNAVITGIISGGEHADVIWQGAAGRSYEIIANAEPIADMNAFDADTADYHATGINALTHRVTGLSPLSRYYVYLRSDCDDNESGYTDWVSSQFATAASVPFYPELTNDNLNTLWEKKYGAVSANVDGTSLTENTSSSYNWFYTSNTAVTGSGHYYGQVYYTYSTGYFPGWLISPLIDLSEMSTEDVVVSFRAALTSGSNSSSASNYASSSDLWVMVSEDNGESWAVLDSVGTGNLTNEAVRYTYHLGDYAGASIRLAVVAIASSTSPYFHIDGFRVAVYDPQCAGIKDVKAQAISGNEAQVTWTANSTNANAVVVVSSSSQYEDSLQTITSASPVTLSSLNPNTTYYVAVRQDCDGSDVFRTSFKTPCAANEEYPWTEDFNTRTSGAFNADCWTNEHISGNGSDRFAIYTSSNGGNSTRQLRLPDMSAGTLTRLMLPPMAIDAPDAYAFRLEVYRNASGSSYPAEGVRIFASLGDENDESAVELGFISRNCTVASGDIVSAESTTGWYGYEFNIPLSGDVNIIVRGESQYGAATYLDNFRVRKLPNCRDLTSVISVTSVDVNSVTLDFASTNAPQYQVVIASKSIDPDSLATDSAVLITRLFNSNHIVLESDTLESNTLYYAYVRGYCGEEDGYGAWDREVTFKTACLPYAISEFGTETFADENVLDCWKAGVAYTGDNHSYVYAQRSVAASTFGSYLRLSRETSTTSYDDGPYVVTPKLDFGEGDIRQYQMVFSAGTNSKSASNLARLRVGVLFDPNDLSALYTAKIVDLPYAADSTELKEYTVSFASYPGFMDYYGQYIILQAEATETHDSTNYVVIDNIRFEPASSCEQIIEAAVRSISTNSASLAWEDMSVSNYQVMLASIDTKRPDTISNPISITDTETNSATVDDLSSNTLYYAYIRSICGAGDTAKWSNSVSFRTTIAIPYQEPFAATGFSDGWKVLSGSATGTMNPDALSVPSSTTSNKWSVVSTGLPTGMSGTVARSYASDGYPYSWLVSPVMDLTENADDYIWLKFLMAGSNLSDYGTVAVWISEDAGKTFSELKRIENSELSAEAKEFTIKLNRYAGKQIALAFYTYQSSYSSSTERILYLDDVRVETYDALCMGIDSLSAVVNGLSLTASWAIEGRPVKAQVELAKSATFDEVLQSESLDGDLNYTFDDLEYSSSYYVRVKQLECDSAQWVVYGPVKTPIAVPYSETFSASTLPSDWTNMSGSPESAFAGTNPSSSSSGWGISSSSNGLPANHLRINIYSSNNNKWIVSPAISMENVETDAEVNFSFDFAYTDYNSSRGPDAGSNQALLLLVSEDNGATWAQSNSWEWCHTDSLAAVRYGLDTISTTGSHIQLDFSRFAGKNIRIAFVATTTSGDNDFHIANVALREVIANCDDPDSLALVGGDLQFTATWRGDEEKVSVLETSTLADFSTVLRRDTIPAGELSFVVDNLDASTNYYARVLQLCGNKTTNYSAPASVVTNCADIAVFPWTESFENHAKGSTASPAPVCWEILNANDGNYPYIYVNNSSSYVKTGTQSLYFVSSSTRYGYAIMPMVDSVNTKEITLFYKDESASSSGRLYLGYMTDPRADSTFVQLVEIPRSTSFAEFNYSLDAIPDSVLGAARLAFKYGGASNNYYLGIDDITISRQASCRAPKDFVLTDIEATSAHIAFTAMEAEGYQVVVASREINPDSIAASDSTAVVYLANDLSATACDVVGLQASTSYYVYARVICGATEISDWSKPAVFTTACAAVAVPYAMTFESVETSQMPNCWNVIDDKVSNTYTPRVVSSYSHGGSKALALGYTSYTSDTQYKAWVVLPEMEEDINKLELSFWMRTASQYGSSSYNETSDSLIIGVMTDPTDTTTFVRVDAVYPSSTSYEQAEVSFAAYAGDGKFIAIKRQPLGEPSSYSNGYNYGYYYNYYYCNPAIIDDINVHLLPSCPKIKKWSVLPAATSANVSFEAEGVEGVEVILTKIPIVPDSLSSVAAANIVSHDTVTVSPVQISGMAPVTTYYAYIRALCGEGGNGEWSEATFTTTCAEIVVDETTSLTENFNDLTSGIPECWDNSEGTTTTESYKWTYYATGHEGVGLRFNSYSNSSNKTNVLATPTLVLTQPSGLSFYWMNPTGGAGEVLISKDGGATRDTLENELTGIAEWTKFDIDLSAYMGDTVIIYFKGTSNYGYGDAYLYLDDIVVAPLPDCAAPGKLKVSEIGAKSATISWSGEAETYQVAIGRAGFALPAAADSIYTLDTTALNLADLIPSTAYDVYVRSVCDEDLFSAWTAAKSFTTLCLVPMGTSYTFDNPASQYELYGTSYSSYLMENCWTGLYSSTSYLPQVKEDYTTSDGTPYGYSYSNNGALYFYTSSSYSSVYAAAVMPAIDANLDTLKIRFMGRAGYMYNNSMSNASSTYANAIKVGTMTDPNDITTFQLIKECKGVSTSSNPSSDPEGTEYWRQFDVNLTGATGQYIAFVSDYTGYNYFCVDNVQILRADACPTPAAPLVSEISQHSAFVSWSPVADAYVLALFQGSDTINQYVVSNDSASIHLTGLDAATSYQLKLRLLCGEDEVSEWSDLASFVTECDILEVGEAGWSENFNSLEAGIPACWDNSEGTTTTESNKWSYYASGHEGKGLRFDSYSNSRNNTNVLATPELVLTQPSALSFYWKNPTGGAGEVLISKDGGANRVSLESKLANVSTWTQYEIDLSAYAGDTVIIYFKGTSNYGSGDAYLYLDDVAVASLPDCRRVTGLATDTISGSGATITFPGTGAEGYQIIVASAEVNINAMTVNDSAMIDFNDDHLTDTFAIVNGLTSNTTYYAYVRSICGDGEFGDWSTAFTFHTECGVVELPYADNFDNTANRVNNAPKCWTISASTTGSTARIDVDTYSYEYAKSGSGALSIASLSNSSVIAALPEVQSAEQLKLTFSARALYAMSEYDYYNEDYVESIESYATSSYAHSIQIGYLTDPTDKSTFVRVRDIQLQSVTGGYGVSVANDTTGKEYWEDFEVIFPASEEGRYIAFVSDYSLPNNVWIDDVQLSIVNPNCSGVDSLVISGVSHSGLTVDFRYLDGEMNDAIVMVSAAPKFDFSKAAYVDTLHAANHAAISMNLAYGATYYVFVAQYCGEDGMSPYISSSFAAPMGIRYEPVFSSTTLPSNWSRYSGSMDAVLAGTAALSASSYGWTLVGNDTVVGATHFRGNIYGSTWNNWVVTPSIDLTENAGDGLLLSLDAGLTPYSSAKADVRNNGTDDRFAVLVTADNGASWTKVAEWNNTGTGDYVYNDVPELAATYNLDLSRFGGKTIRIAFYGESTQENADNYFHFGNIVLDKVAAAQFHGQICSGNDYDGTVDPIEPNPFIVTADNYVEGLNIFSEYRPSTGAGDEDSLLVLQLMVYGFSSSTYEVTLCEGEHYDRDENGFEFDAVYGMNDKRIRLTSALGCDSVVTLHINVIRAVEEHIYDSVAQGDGYTWNGTEYYLAGTYEFKTKSLVTGCDSTAVLHLSVYQKPVDPEDQAVGNITAQSLIIAPNPVKAGEPIHILNSFSAEMLAEARIEVISATGALVYTQHGAEKPFMLPGIAVSGVYTVRIVIGNEIFISSLLVH